MFHAGTRNLELFLGGPEDPLWSYSSSILLVGAWSPISPTSTWQENLSPALKSGENELTASQWPNISLIQISKHFELLLYAWPVLEIPESSLVSRTHPK